MVDFTEDQIEDIKDGFDLYDRKGSTGTSFVSLVRNYKFCQWMGKQVDDLLWIP